MREAIRDLKPTPRIVLPPGEHNGVSFYAVSSNGKAVTSCMIWNPRRTPDRHPNPRPLPNPSKNFIKSKDFLTELACKRTDPKHNVHRSSVDVTNCKATLI